MTEQEIRDGAPKGAHIYAIGKYGDVFFRKTPKKLYYWNKARKKWMLSWMDGNISNRLKDYQVTKLVNINDDWSFELKPL